MVHPISSFLGPLEVPPVHVAGSASAQSFGEGFAEAAAGGFASASPEARLQSPETIKVSPIRELHRPSEDPSVCGYLGCPCSRPSFARCDSCEDWLCRRHCSSTAEAWNLGFYAVKKLWPGAVICRDCQTDRPQAAARILQERDVIAGQPAYISGRPGRWLNCEDEDEVGDSEFLNEDSYHEEFESDSDEEVPALKRRRLCFAETQESQDADRPASESDAELDAIVPGCDWCEGGCAICKWRMHDALNDAHPGTLPGSPCCAPGTPPSRSPFLAPNIAPLRRRGVTPCHD